MKKKVRLVFELTSVILIVLLMIFAGVNWKQIATLKSENALIWQEIQKLQSKTVELEMEDLEQEYNRIAAVEYDKNGYNYLAIGNSITVHSKCEYWWNEIGMAATNTDKDYFYQVTEFLEEKYGNVVSYPVNYSAWEVQAADRSETYQIIDKYLSPDLNLITIQLSENVSEVDTFEVDFFNLIQHIKEKCPNGKIILVDEFWNEQKSTIKREIAEKCNLDFADLLQIRQNPEYESRIGTVVYGDDGSEYVIEHAGVASHPNDKGMEFIANAIKKLLSD